MVKVNAFEVNPSTSVEKTEILIQFVLDETGSMNFCRDDTISSFNDYLGSQASLSSDKPCYINLNKFSDSLGSFSYSLKPNHSVSEPIRTIYENVLVNEAVYLNNENYTPSGSTNLYDAIGMTITNLDKLVKPNQDVLVVIITDGGENSSREYTLSAIKTMIADRQAKGWTFVYLGANQDAWSVGQTFGLSKGQTMTYSTTDMASTMSTLNVATSMYRSARSFASTAESNAAGATSFNFFVNTGEKK
jgi:hypothetical protein